MRGDSPVVLADGGGVDLRYWFERHESDVPKYLNRYFFGDEDHAPFTGRHFEHYSKMGDLNRFEPSDLLAIESLSVSIPKEVAAELFIEEVDYFSELLGDTAIPADTDIWDVPSSTLEDNQPAAELHSRLRTLDDVSWVKAGKLMASKRPRLVPILDDFVKSELKPPPRRFWVYMHDQLADEDRRKYIAEVCSNAPDRVGLLRRIDVAVWMHVWVRKHEGG